jgi:integrase
VTLQTFAESWLATQTTDPATVEAVASRLRVHVYPHLGPYELRAIRPSVLQGWLAQLQTTLAPAYVRVILANVSAILGAAVEDGLLVKNPARSKAIRAPRVDAERIVPWSTERVEQVTAAHPERYWAVPAVAAGCGLRQGEVFGLAVEDVDFLGRWVLVQQQVKLLKGKPVLAPPKGGKTREVPLPEVVAFALAEHLRRYPPVEVTLPWRTLEGKPRTAALVFTTRERGPLVRRHYNVNIWKRALKESGVEPTRANGMHALRHYYASVLLEDGVTVRALADYLGHVDPGFTLRVYAHLMPAAEGRARAAIDAVLGSSAGQMRAKATEEA